MIGMRDLYRWGGFFRVRVEGGIKRCSFINRSTVGSVIGLVQLLQPSN